MNESKARRHGRRRMIAAILTGLSAPAFGQSVPLPAPRPHSAQPPAATGSINAPAKPVPEARPQVTQNQPPPSPITNPFAALLGQPGSTATFNTDQRAIIQRVEDYLSKTQVLSGNFVQVGPDGRRSQGEFFIQKPGRVRFDYDPPSPIDIIADGQTMVVRDRKLATQDIYPLSQTPLRFLLSDHVDLLHDTNLISVLADDVYVTIVVEEKNGVVGTSRLMIMFSAKDMQLKQWTVTDPQGYDTTVAVYNLDTSKRPDPNMFHIDFTNYRN